MRHLLSCVLLLALSLCFVGCGQTGINPLPGTDISFYEGSFAGPYQGDHNEKGTLAINVARNGSFQGTINDTLGPGVISGIVRQDGNFKGFYHYANNPTIHSGTGLLTLTGSVSQSQTSTSTTTTSTATGSQTQTGGGISGNWNFSQPTVTTFTFTLLRQ